MSYPCSLARSCLQIILLSNISVNRAFFLRSSTIRVHSLRKKTRFSCSWRKIFYLETDPNRPLQLNTYLPLFCLVLGLILVSAPVSGTAAQQVSQENSASTRPVSEKPLNGRIQPESRAKKDLPPPAVQSSMPSFGKYQPCFYRYEIPLAEKLLGMWNETMSRYQSETVFGAKQQFMKGTLAMQWKNITAQMPSMAQDKKLRVINGFFNNFRSRSDLDNYGIKEYWASPREFLQKASGDCEDYAIIKYLALRYFSWPAENLWVVLVTDNKTKGQHAVLVGRFGSTIFVLDNLSKPKYLLVPAKDYMTRYTPYFAINELGGWLFLNPDAPKKAQHAAKKKPSGDGSISRK